MKKKLIMAALGLTSLSLAAPIKSIEITNLNGLPKDVVESLLPVSVGQEFSNKVLSDIYLSFLRTGLIQNVNTEYKNEEDGVALKLIVDEVKDAKEKLQNILEIKELQKKTEFKVNNIKVVGTNFDVSQIINNSSLKKGEYFAPFDARLVEQLLAQTGYFTSVETKVERDAENKLIDLTFIVKEYPKIKSITIEGSTLFDKKQILELSGLRVGDVLTTKYLSIEESPILNTYRNAGFVWVTFKDVEVNEEGDVKIIINEGKVSEVNFAKKVNITEEGRLSEKNYKLKTKQYIFDRNNYIQKGAPLNKNTLELTLRELLRTGIFSTLNHEIIPDPKNPDNIKVTIYVTERPSTSINANVAYSTEDSLSGGLKLADTNFLGTEQSIDISGEAGIRGTYGIEFSYKDPWVKDTDRLLLGVSAFFKQSKTRVETLYDKLPKGKDKKQFEKEIEDKAFFEATNKQYSYGLTGQIGKGITRDIYLTISPKLLGIYAKNKYQEKEEVDENGKKVLKPKSKGVTFQDYNLLSVGTDLIYDTRDDRNLPKKGFFLDFYVEAGYIFRDKSILASQNKEKVEGANKEFEQPAKKESGKYLTQSPRAYITSTLDLRAYHKTIGDINSMAYRILATASHANTPSQRNFTIGDGITLRGQQKAAGAQFGAAFTAENRTYINEYVQAVAFYEMGVVSVPLRDGGLTARFAHDIGLGARIFTPIGILRLDYAWDLPAGKIGLSDHKKPVGKFNFGFGQTF